MPILEFLSFTASSGLLADPTLADPTYRYLKTADGCLDVHAGFQLEEPNRLVVVITWATPAHRRRTTTHPSYATTFLAALPTNDLAGSLSTQLVPFNGDPAHALGAPLTDASLVMMKAGQTQAEVERLFVLTRDLGVTLRDGEYKGAVYPTEIVWGPVVGDEDVASSTGTYIFLCGWDSIESHREYLNRARERVDLACTVEEIFAGLSDLAVRHVALKRVS